jgi:hypothetical protein
LVEIEIDFYTDLGIVSIFLMAKNALSDEFMDTSFQPFSQKENDILKRCRQAGVALDFVKINASSTSNEFSHRKAAICAIRHLQRNKLPFARSHSDSEPHRQFATKIEQEIANGYNPTRLKGTLFRGQDFFGSLLDAETGEVYENREDTCQTPGKPWAKVFLDPPYGLRVHGDERYLLIHETILTLFGIPLKDIEGWRWDGDFSSYFDSGNEWWGAYVWTVAINPHTFLVTGASATD